MTITPTLLLRCTTGNSDKIWGYIQDKTSNGKSYTFWGKVGGVVAFKSWDAGWESNQQIRRLEHAKKSKKYKEVNMTDLPYDAQEKYDQAVVMATLGLLRIK
jgi:hypothetical protein